MQVISPSQFLTSSWKNGAGKTHEIRRHEGPNGYAWRLSLAEVDDNGPFSTFDGMSRILTVVSGTGMVLSSPSGDEPARFLKPVHFPGGLPINGTLIDGPVKNFNLIFDPSTHKGEVHVLEHAIKRLEAHPRQTHAVFAINDGVFVNGVPLYKHQCAMTGHEDVNVQANTASAVIVTLTGE